MNATTRALVRLRAGRRCEYCRFHEDDLPLYAFHVEHIIPRKHGGTEEPSNLAWSCHFCNLCKSSNLSGRDRSSGRIVRLFNPRRQRWQRHFSLTGACILGLTPCGRATVATLNFNVAHRVRLRRSLIRLRLFSTD